MLYQLTWNNNKRENPMCLTAGFVRVLSGFLQLLPTPNLDKVYIIEFLKHQLHEGELTGWIVDELWIRLIPGEQATFSCPFVTGERSHRNRRRLPTALANDKINHFFSSRYILIVHACKTNVFSWTLSLYTLATNKNSFYRARPCGTMNSLAGNRNDAFV